MEDVIEEFSEEKSGSLVFLLGLTELGLETLMLMKQGVILLLFNDHISLLLLQFLFQEVDKVVIAAASTSLSGHIIKHSGILRFLHTMVARSEADLLSTLIMALHTGHLGSILKLLL